MREAVHREGELVAAGARPPLSLAWEPDPGVVDEYGGAAVVTENRLTSCPHPPVEPGSTAQRLADPAPPVADPSDHLAPAAPTNDGPPERYSVDRDGEAVRGLRAGIQGGWGRR
ncbi:MAG: hypothetical protein OXT72_05460 [Gammaproteobacteria bacterium]|nr:hypothetical protein [Gammaproteobacteria bacterium]MDE0247799.1 hypothetical protein [Gammaproteobacteria bacterium]